MPYVPLQRTTFQFFQASSQLSFVANERQSKSTSALCVYIPKVSTRPIGMSLTKIFGVKLNRVRIGVGRFSSSMHKWSLASSARCEGGASEQTTIHIILTCLTHRAPRGIMDLTVLDDKTRCWLNSITASTRSGQQSRLGW